MRFGICRIMSIGLCRIVSIAQRSHNVVVSGLPTNNQTNDSTLFEELCFSMLDITPHVKSTYRFGKQSSAKPQLLLVTLGSAETADAILKSARYLRQSSSAFIRENVFINKHMTKAESLAAYNARVKKRNSKQQHELIDLDDHDSSPEPASTSILMVQPSKTMGNKSSEIQLLADLSQNIVAGANDSNNPCRAHELHRRPNNANQTDETGNSNDTGNSGSNISDSNNVSPA